MTERVSWHYRTPNKLMTGRKSSWNSFSGIRSMPASIAFTGNWNRHLSRTGCITIACCVCKTGTKYNFEDKMHYAHPWCEKYIVMK